MQKRYIGLIALILVLLVSGNISAFDRLKANHLKHEPDQVRFNYLTGDGRLNLRLQVQRQGVDKVELIYDDNSRQLTYYGRNNFYQYYVARFKPTDKFDYYFKITKGDQMVYFGEAGPVTNESEVEVFHFVRDSVQTFSTPDWAKGAVIYQIFPERFYNGDPSNDPEDGEWDVYGTPVEAREWDRHPAQPPRGSDFFGGDLQGVIDKLDYLEELGITAIYFNPLHESVSNHKYDASDYMKIDDNFGTNQLFKELVKKAEERGIYIIVDGVFNHTGANFWAFQDIVENGQDSKYVDWYDIYSFPVSPEKGNYASWHGYSSLPKLNYKNPEVQEHILKVARHWIDLGAKGIRLDAPTEVPHKFWQKLYRNVKEVDPEVLLIGEVWGDASPWINNNEFDSSMNYNNYRDAMIKFFIGRFKRPGSFVRQLGMDTIRYPEPVVHTMFNLVSSHDVARYLTLANGNPELIKPSVIFQFTYLGAPSIYYGDEVGVEGGKDPDCRRPMIWDEDKQNKELLSLYKKMIEIRNGYPALQKGSFRILFTDDKQKFLVFEREYQGQRVISIINNSNEPYSLEIPFEEWDITLVKDVLNGGLYIDEIDQLELKANYGAVLIVK